jgi:hypothetical protein
VVVGLAVVAVAERTQAHQEAKQRGEHHLVRTQGCRPTPTLPSAARLSGSSCSALQTWLVDMAHAAHPLPPSRAQMHSVPPSLERRCRSEVAPRRSKRLHIETATPAAALQFSPVTWPAERRAPRSEHKKTSWCVAIARVVLPLVHSHAACLTLHHTSQVKSSQVNQSPTINFSDSLRLTHQTHRQDDDDSSFSSVSCSVHRRPTTAGRAELLLVF